MKAQFRLIAPVLFMTFAIFSVVNAQVLDEFTAVVDGHNVVLEWSNNAENDVTKYCIQRSFDGRNYYTISNLLPEGNGHTYQYIDDSLYKNNIRTFYYRIEVRHNGGRSLFSRTREVTLSFSGILRTWGSIKAMFR
ncbi:hypothetical protein HQ587_11185 [bacterium]|nr:hypothetical protein [bacterium]